jgi:alkylation response protein AidB-like acyl-CoA dehydrogenase
VPKGEDRPRIAIETAEAWTRGEATIEQVYAAAYAADAADVAFRAARAAYAAAYAASRAAALKDMADIVRKIIPFSVIKRAIADYEGTGGKA